MRTPLLLLSFTVLFNTEAQINLGSMMPKGSGAGMTVEDDTDPFVPNSFIGSFRMENHMYKNDVEEKNSPVTMRYWATAEQTLIKTELPEQNGDEMRMLTDLKGKWQYMLLTDTKGKKTAIKTKKKKITVKEDAKHPETKVTVTEETKVIDGHTCVQMIAENEKGTWIGWVAKDMPAPFSDMARNVKTGDPALTKRMAEMQGFPLEFQWVDANGKDRMVCYMRDVLLTPPAESLFSLDGYEVTEMPSMTIGQ
jgi:GLPGLI family protein